MVHHYPIRLSPLPRGIHLITSTIVNELPQLPDSGILALSILHTSAAICINENADPTVRTDLENVLDYLVPENLSFLKHTYEGPDDMPAHVKAALIGQSITIPIIDRSLHLGTWQGIFLCEFRNNGGTRNLIASVYQ